MGVIAVDLTLNIDWLDIACSPEAKQAVTVSEKVPSAMSLAGIVMLV